MIIILGAQQRSLLTMATRIIRDLSASLYLFLSLPHRILFYISIISLFSSSSFACYFFVLKILRSVICHSSLILYSIPYVAVRVLLAIWENCIIPVLSSRFSTFISSFSFGFSLWRQRNLIFSAWIYCRPAASSFFFLLQLERILSITPECFFSQTILYVYVYIIEIEMLAGCAIVESDLLSAGKFWDNEIKCGWIENILCKL